MKLDNIEDYPVMPKKKYESPANPVIKTKRKHTNQKTLVVMNTYIPESGQAEYKTRSYNDHEHGGYLHDRIECLKFTLACYKHYNAGADYDLIIVDNTSPYFMKNEYGPGYLDNDGNDFMGTSLYFRENTYYSFGAYRWAFEKFGQDYDYFVFHEFDWCPAKDNWLKDLIDYWNSDNQIGMIGNLIEEFDDNGENETINRIVKKVAPSRNSIYNLDSEYLFTDKKVLEQMEENGGWNIFPCSPETNETPIVNELGLQQPILEMGYKLACMNDGEHTMFYSIYNSGFPKKKWFYGLDKLAPFVPEQTRNFVPEMAEYFKWYSGEKSLVKFI